MGAAERGLREAAAEPDPCLRILRIAGLLQQALSQLDLSPVLVGGAALEFYTDSRYQTHDLDFVMPQDDRVVPLMESLGFEKRGKDYLHPSIELWVEFPSSQLDAHDTVRVVEGPSGTVRILSPESLLIDRVRAFVYWRSSLDGRNALLLLAVEEQLDLDFAMTALLEEPAAARALEALITLQHELSRSETTESSLEDRLYGILEAR